jgi:hypothetical protein
MVMTVQVAIARGEVTPEEVFNPFLKDILRYLTTSTLIEILKDLYDSIEYEGNPDWDIIWAYEEVKAQLEANGYHVRTEQTGHEWEVIVTGAQMPL